MELVLVRHPEASDEMAGRCYGRLDVDLSPRGRELCTKLAERLSSERVDAVVASPLRRAREAADAIATRHGLPVSILPELRELDFGELEGRSFEEIGASWPALFERWMRAPTTVRFPGGECYDELQERVAETVADLCARHDGQVVVAVTHAGVIRAALARALELPSDAVFRLAVDPGSITRIAWFDGTPRVLGVNIPTEARVGQ
jgi:alpha-ribazole phosphatase